MGAINILGIVGSQRQESANRRALMAVQHMAPPRVSIDLIELHGIPFFEPRHAGRPPPAVVEFRRRLLAADAVLIATPECNHDVPGGLKSAIDWAARPEELNAWRDKPATVMSATAGRLVKTRSQAHLLCCLAKFGVAALDAPALPVGHGDLDFTLEGWHIGQPARLFVNSLLAGLVDLVRAERAKQLHGDREVA